MAGKRQRRGRKGRKTGFGIPSTLGAIASQKENISIPFHNYNTCSTGFSSFYLRPSNIGLSHITALASVYALWRVKSLEITLYPSGSVAASYSSYRSANNASVADMSQNDAFSLITSGETTAKSIKVPRAALSRAKVAPWCFTNTSLSPSDQGLVSLYASGASGFYQIRGVIEFAAPLKTGVLSSIHMEQHFDDEKQPILEPTPTPTNPPNPNVAQLSGSNAPVEAHGPWLFVKPPLKRS